MELAIPLVALGGLYCVSNKKKKRVMMNEGYINQHNLLNQGTMLSGNELANEINKYDNPNNNYTKKYYSEENNNTMKDMNHTGINGEKMDMTHNNMVPYFGRSKSNGGAFMENSPTDTILDSMQGNNSMGVEKEELAPLFKPEENIQWAWGSPNQNEFMQSRQQIGMMNNNINPWKENVQITPGLNKGYNTNEHTGFNSGMEARDSWQPKTVDELRTASNPKIRYDLKGHQGPAQSKTTSRGIFGKMEKHLPEKFYINTPERYLTTTGLQKAPTIRSLHNNRQVNRAISVEYTGAPNMSTDNGMAESNYRVGNKAYKQLPGCNIGPAQIGTNKVIIDNKSDFKQNNRTINKELPSKGMITGMVNSATAPLMDIIKPTRKEGLVDSVRVMGNPAGSVPKSTFFDPNNKVKTTTKETTQYSPYDYGSRPVNMNQSGAYEVTEQQPIHNQRETTSTDYVGAAGNYNKQTSYESIYNQTINSNRSNEMQMNHGNTNMFNSNMNQSTNDAKSNLHVMQQQYKNGNLNSSIPSTETYGKMLVPAYQQSSPSDRIENNLLKAFKENPYTHSLSSVA